MPDQFIRKGKTVFMRTYLMLVLVGITALSAPTMTIAAPAAESSATGTCAALSGDYAGIEKALALRHIEGVGDDSAPRATERAARDTADIARAQLLVTLMEGHHCALPDHAASSATYALPAMECDTDEMKGNPNAPSCKMEDWQPRS